jgi:3-oxoacyl-[acyl-carrier protein] reductase
MKKGSCIIFISSSLCHFSSVSPDFLLYCTCKGAIEQMTRVMAKDLARKQINVNAVAPGPVDDEHFRMEKSDEAIAKIQASVPAGRLSEVEEIADAIVMLCSHASRWVTGQVIRVNGGMV